MLLARTGRPRKQRDACGTIAADTAPGPTPEAQALIDFRVGTSRRGEPGSPMGVLVAHGLVDEEICSQITTPYMVAMKKRFGSYGPAMAGDGTAHGHDGSDSDASERRAKRTIAKCDKVLKALKYQACRTLFHSFVVLEEFPSWMQPRIGVHDVLVDIKTDEIRYSRRLRLDPENPELKMILITLARLADEYRLKTAAPHYTNFVRHPFQQHDPNHEH